jgi:hypothetical protein
MMTRNVLAGIISMFILSLLITQVRAQQRILISADKMNIAYLGMDNPLTIVAEGYGCDQIVASCSNGTLTKGIGCQYFFRPEKEGFCDIVLRAKTKKGTKEIGKTTYKVRLAPTGSVSLAGKSSGKIADEIFKVQKGLSISFNNAELECDWRIQKYRIVVVRDSELLYEEDNYGPFFNDKFQGQLKTLKAGDRVIFENIKAVDFNDRTRSINTMTFTLY